MRAWVALVCLLLWPAAALGQGANGFDLRALGNQDARFLQAALVWSGDYAGLTDGDWGTRSQEALDRWVARSGAGDLRPLLLDLAEEVAEGGWTTLNLEGVTVALPTRFLRPGPEEPDSLEFRSPGDDLVFRLLLSSPREAWEMHAWMMGNHAGPGAPYQSARDDRIVSAITLPNGREVYLRSAFLDGLGLSMQVVNEPWQERRADLIASTMQWGSAPDLWPEPGGLLEALLLGPEGRPGQPAPLNPPRALPPAGPLLGTGTGFFVAPDVVVTAAHVVEQCRDVRLEDGSPLRLLAYDRALDLAALAASRPSGHWLPLGPPDGPRLGEPVLALGFPFFGLDMTANQGLSVTTGNVSSLPRVADARSRVQITTPVQPGNSGGPLLSDDGQVLGVVVSRANDLAVLEREGVIPQNMNQATSVSQLLPFLEAAGLAVDPPGTAPPRDLSQGIPDEVQEAVVLIGCH